MKDLRYLIVYVFLTLLTSKSKANYFRKIDQETPSLNVKLRNQEKSLESYLLLMKNDTGEIVNLLSNTDSSSIVITYGSCQETIGFYFITHILPNKTNYGCTLLSLEPNAASGFHLQNLAGTHFKKILILQQDLLWFFFNEAKRNTLIDLKVYLVGISDKILEEYRHEFPYFVIKKYLYQQFEDWNIINSSFFNFTKIQELKRKSKAPYGNLRVRMMETNFIIKQTNFHFRAVTALYAPFVMTVRKPKLKNANDCGEAKLCKIATKNRNGTVIWQSSCCSGFALDFFEMVRRKLNFEYTLYVVEDGNWGRLENGSWNGMIGDLVSDKADFIVNIMTPLKKRAEYIHFTNHFMESNFGIARVKEMTSEDFPNYIFLRPIGNSLQMVLVISTITTLLIISFFENLNAKFASNRTVFIQESMAYVFGLTFQRDMGGTNPRMWSGRLAALGYASAMTIIMSIYTARITANSIEQVVLDDFKGFYDDKFQHPTEDYIFTMVGGHGWAVESYFKDHPDESFRRMYKFMSKYFVGSVTEGVQKLLDGSIQAFITDSGSFPVELQQIISELGCSKKIELLESTYVGKHGMTFAYRKNFVFGEMLSNTLLSLYETDALTPLRKKWFPSSSCNGQAVVEQFNWTYFSGILVIVGYTVVIGILVNLIEHCYVFLKNKYKNQL